mgnify:CR=1 FL=1
MITFNELRVTPNNVSLIVDASVINSDYYDNIYIESIVIDTQDTYIKNSPSSKAVYNYTVEEGENQKRIRLTLKEEDLGIPINGNMFFVYVITTGEYKEDTPCELKRNINIGTAVNLYPIYKKAVEYTRELANTCSIPKNFIDFILKIKALDLNIKTGNYYEAIGYWNKMFKTFNVGTDFLINNNCGCDGRDY